MKDRTKRILENHKADIHSQISRARQPEYVLLWVVDQEGNELEHEFIQMYEAMAMVDSFFKPSSAKQTRVKEKP